jgi:predicted  nucleic acid-binding Zn-ribbon protein
MGPQIITSAERDNDQRSKKIDTCQQDLTTAIQEKNDLSQKVSEQHERIKKLRTSKEFTAHREEGNRLSAQVQQARQNILDQFANLKSAFRKYSKSAVEHDDIVSKYAADPLDAIASDLALDICKVSLAMRTKITSLGLKPEKEEKVVIALEKITKERVSQLQHEFAQVKATYEKYLSGSAQQPIVQSIRTLTDTIHNHEQAVDEVQATIQQLTKTIAQLRTQDEYDQLVSETVRLLDITLV